MVIVQYAFSLVRPALNVVGMLVLLVVAVCAPPVVAVSSLVKSYGWPVLRVLLWLVRNVYRVVVGALFVARISAWLHALAARLGMGVGRTLTNAALFARDQHLCLYCGRHFHRQSLTRDHVLPISRGGRDIWENVVTACFACNSRKGGRTPAQASMPLLAVPYRPSWIEHLILSNRNILADQMAFLSSQLPKRRRH